MSTLFISHSSQDVVWCRAFVAALRAAGYACFYDQDSIPGTAQWVATIEQGVRECDLFLLVLTPDAWKSQWVQDERQLAQAQRKPILTVQQKTTPDVDGFLTIRQWVNAVGSDAATAAQLTMTELARLGQWAQAPTTIVLPPSPVDAPIPLPARLARLGFRGYAKQGVEYIVPPVCDVPAGPFIMGSDKQRDAQAYDGEQPQYQIVTGNYQIGAYPLTVAEYACAITANAVKMPPKSGGITWQKQLQHPDHPVGCISWLDARIYVDWLEQMTGQSWRLPTEAEWEKAARGIDGRIYPWGNKWDKSRANTTDGGPQITTPIGTYEEDASPFGAHDMAGNVWEWTSSLVQPYPYRYNQVEKDTDTISLRVLRGGSWDVSPRLARAACRDRLKPSDFGDNVGVRLVRGAAAGT